MGRVIAAIAFSLAACADKAPPAARPAIDAATAPVGETGVPECDELLKKHRKCVADNVPEAERKTGLYSLESRALLWKKDAPYPETRANAVTQCKEMLAQRKAVRAMGCDW